MNGEIKVNWPEVGKQIEKLDNNRHSILVKINQLGLLIEDNRYLITGSKADGLRKRIVELIGIDEFEGPDTLKTLYNDMVQLNNDLKLTLQRLAQIDNYPLQIRDKEFYDDVSHAWSFIWKTDDSGVHMASKNEIGSNLREISDVLENVDWDVAAYLGNLQELIYNETFSSPLNDEIIAVGRKFLKIADDIKNEVDIAIINIDDYVENVMSAIHEMGQMLEKANNQVN